MNSTFLCIYICLLLSIFACSMKKTFLKMSKQVSPKLISIIRHGRTEMNEVLSKHRWGDPNFNDAELWDTRLTEIGQKQARQLNEALRDPNSKYAHLLHADLIVSSPLSRALHTAQLAFGDTRLFPVTSSTSSSSSTASSSTHIHVDNKAPRRLVHPLASERVYLSSDTGRHHAELSDEFPHWDYTLLQPLDKWWYHDPIFEPRRLKKGDNVNGYVEWRPEGYYAVAGEPTEVFRERMRALRQWLEDRSERHIVLVCHWAVARALTGSDLTNCEVKTLEISEILQDPFIDED